MVLSCEVLCDWDKQYVWHPFTQMQDYEKEIPLIITKAEGIYLYDIEGKKYIDGVSSLWTNVHGHRKKEIDNAIKSQLDNVAHSTLLGIANVPSIELAKKLVDIVPRGLCKVFYSDNGSTSVEIALKMAYQYFQQREGVSRKKKKIAHIINSYHGDTLGSVSVGGIDLFHKIYKPLLFDTIQVELPEQYRFDSKSQGMSWEEKSFVLLEDIFKKHGEVLCAFIIEPILQGAAGMLEYPDGYLKKVKALCDKHQVLLIADEVATGFGRTGTMFACEQESVTPDIICLSKGITGGYLPLAATITTSEVYKGFLGEYKECKTFFHGHTYTGNPLGCAAAIANLDIFEKENVLGALKDKIDFVSKMLREFYKIDCVGHVRQKGFMIGIELVKNKNTKEPFAFEERIGVQVIKKARNKGVIIRPLGNVIVLIPPLSSSTSELEKLLNIVQESIKEVWNEYK